MARARYIHWSTNTTQKYLVFCEVCRVPFSTRWPMRRYCDNCRATNVSGKMVYGSSKIVYRK